MKIKAINAECREGMVAVELAYIKSCKARGARSNAATEVGVTMRDSTSPDVGAPLVAGRLPGSAVEHAAVQMVAR